MIQETSETQKHVHRTPKQFRGKGQPSERETEESFLEPGTPGLSVREGLFPGVLGQETASADKFRSKTAGFIWGNRRPLSLAGANITTEGDRLSTEVGPRSQRASFIMMNEPVLYSVSDGESEKCFTQGDTIRFHSTLCICQVYL